MNPAVLSALMSLGSQGVGAAANMAPFMATLWHRRNRNPESPFMQVGEASDVQQINPFMEQQYASLTGRTDESLNSLREYLAQADQYGGQAADLLGQVTGFESRAAYDPQAGFRQFLSQAPQLQALAQESYAPQRSDERLRSLQDQIARQVGDQFGGNASSGAFASAVSEGMSQPVFQMEQQRRQNVAGLQNALMGQAQSAAEQANQFGYQAQRQGEQDYLSQLLSGAEGLQGLASGQRQGASLYGDLAGTFSGQASSLAQPEYWQPTYQADPDYVSFGDLMNTFSAGLGGAQAQGAGPSANADALQTILAGLG